MSSSPTATPLSRTPLEVAGSGLLDLLKTVPDPRGRRGRQHALASILAVGLGAVLAGARSFAAIGEWVAHQPIDTLRAVGVTTPAGPDESTIRRVFALLDADGRLVELVPRDRPTRVYAVNGRGEALIAQGEHPAITYWRWVGGELSPVPAPEEGMDFRGFSDRGDVLLTSREDQSAYVIDDEDRVAAVVVTEEDVAGEVLHVRAVAMNSRGQVVGDVYYSGGIPTQCPDWDESTTNAVVPFV